MLQETRELDVPSGQSLAVSTLLVFRDRATFGDSGGERLVLAGGPQTQASGTVAVSTVAAVAITAAAVGGGSCSGLNIRLQPVVSQGNVEPAAGVENDVRDGAGGFE